MRSSTTCLDVVLWTSEGIFGKLEIEKFEINANMSPSRTDEVPIPIVADGVIPPKSGIKVIVIGAGKYPH